MSAAVAHSHSNEREAESRRAVRLVEFNLHVARYAHRSWYERSSAQPLINDIFDAQGRAHGRAQRKMSDWLLHELDLQDEMDWEMTEPQKALWLLERSSLERMAQELSLAMHREWLLQVIDAAQLRSLYSKVDEAAVRFVIEEVPRGPFHRQSPTVSFSSDVIADLESKLKEDGARTLMALLQPTWRAVRGRAQLMFSRSLGLGGVPSFEAAHCDQALEFICGLLVPRRFPEWAWCF
jgi:hypothetical protein